MKSIRIPTPDNAELEFELAGLGSRFAAYCVDLLLCGILIVLSAIGTVGLWLASVGGGGEAEAAWMLAVMTLAFFVIRWGYSVFFELWAGGRTPGKMMFNLRVLRDDALPVTFRESALRNILLIIDGLPPPGGVVGPIMVLFHSESRRLGDLVAGTIVIREEGERLARASGAAWMERVEKGGSRHAVTLPRGTLSAERLALIERFLQRRQDLPPPRRRKIAWQIAEPVLPLMGVEVEEWEELFDREIKAESLLEEILQIAQGGATVEPAEQVGAEKRSHWMRFQARVELIRKNPRRRLRRQNDAGLLQLIDDYRRVTSDLARGRSLGADPDTVRTVNRLAVLGHAAIYGGAGIRRERQTRKVPWIAQLAVAVRRHPSALLLSAVLMFLPMTIGALTIILQPETGYAMVPTAFLDFQPAREDSLHEIPPLARPMVASSILTNNIQVSFLAFGLGLTFGLGTGLVLIFNGVQIGAVLGWMTHSGNGSAFWGWVMPHGATELLAIVLAGAAGLLLAEALLVPGNQTRKAALKAAAGDSLTIVIGVIVMLIIAGLIEGFVSGSSIGFPGRLGILVASIVGWGGYFRFVGRSSEPTGGRYGGQGVVVNSPG